MSYIFTAADHQVVPSRVKLGSKDLCIVDFLMPETAQSLADKNVLDDAFSQS